MDFLTPLGALVCLAGVLPLLALRARRRRHDQVRGALGLGRPARRSAALATVAVVAVFGLLGAAAAQPVVFVDRVVESRTDAEAYVVVDVSRSMLAATSPGAPTRFDRAVATALALRPELPDIPFGVASLTDRPLPSVFPTPDAATYEAVLRRAIGIERPPPEEPGAVRATSLGSLAALAKANFYSAASTHRLAVVLTDAESIPFDPTELSTELHSEGIQLVVVRYWDAGERVWQPSGAPEPYRPDASAGQQLDALAREGTVVLAEDDRAGLAAAARDALGAGPAVRLDAGSRAFPLAAYVALAASLPLAFLLARRGGGRRNS